MRLPRAAATSSSVPLLSLTFAAGCSDEHASVGPGAWSPPQVSALRKPNFSAADRIPDEYIVVFRSDVTDAPGRARALAAREQAQLLHSYSHGLLGFASHMSSTAAERLAADPDVAYTASTFIRAS